MPVRPRRTSPWRLVALVTCLLATAGCLVPGSETEQPRSGAGASPRITANGNDVDGTKSVAEFEGDVTDAYALASQYWAGQMKATRVDFTEVRRVVAYQRAGEVSCGGQELGLRNAAYCAAGDFIAYDVNWAVEAFRQIGDAFVFYLLGHEYAHAIQARLGLRSEFTIQQELQADCMAGAYLGDSVRARTLTLDSGDLDEFSKGLLAVGDDPGQPWFAEGSHGTAEQRTEAFTTGYEGSLARCGLR